MTFLAALALADPLLLPIGRPGTVTVAPGWTRTASGSPASAQEAAKAAEGLRFVFVGESHDNPYHHRAQADMIEALVAEGRLVSVGFEMFTRDNQDSLAPWTLGQWTEVEFIQKASWKTQWGFDYALYRPIFEAVRKHGLPMYALNVPRDWVREVSRSGVESLTPERRAWVPGLDLGWNDHRKVFDSLMEGHPPGAALDGMYRGQVTWDTGMAQSAMDAVAKSKNPRRVMVVVAGIGHMMYGVGINGRITAKTGERVLNVACISGSGAREVSKGLADFVYLSAEPDKGT
ncbi:MAG: ChaN family lipoprotein [Fimbriimonadaceae bacterium]|nr:ChaN family lipoprotein [Fimbriimonadaceae bacterium]